jgi:transcriptional regulator with XRE-family HTH domain
VAASAGAPHDPEPVGSALARMRKANRLTGAQLAAMVGMSQPKISRIERGQGVADPGDVGDIARALGADESLARDLMQRAERSHDRMTDWRPTAISLAGTQKSLAAWEAAAKDIRNFEPAVVPGLLQTSGYARSVLVGFFERLSQPEGAPSRETAVLGAIAERIRRQGILADPARSFRFVITENVLRNKICPPAEMLAQIEHLRQVSARHDNVVIGIVPDDQPVAIPPMHGFVVLDDSMIIIDVYNTGLTSRGRSDAEQYRRVFDVFEEHARTDIEPILRIHEELYVGLLTAS